MSRLLRSDDTEVDWAEVASVDPTDARKPTGKGRRSSGKLAEG
jgi:hypothetical protein